MYFNHTLLNGGEGGEGGCPVNPVLGNYPLIPMGVVILSSIISFKLDVVKIYRQQSLEIGVIVANLE